MRVCVCTPVAVDGPVLLRGLGVLAGVVDNTAGWMYVRVWMYE